MLALISNLYVNKMYFKYQNLTIYVTPLLFQRKKVNGKGPDNLQRNIERYFPVLAQFLFTASKTKIDYCKWPHKIKFWQLR